MPGKVRATKMSAAILFHVVVANQMPVCVQRGDANEGCWPNVQKVTRT